MTREELEKLSRSLARGERIDYGELSTLTKEEEALACQLLLDEHSKQMQRMRETIEEAQDLIIEAKWKLSRMGEEPSWMKDRTIKPELLN